MNDSSSLTDVRQICLKLKPILGSQMDKIYQAYQAEDETGKEQIERYLQILETKYMPPVLGQDDFILVPPTESQAQGEYPLGMVTYSDKPMFEFGLRENEWIQHVAVLGRSGAGKTNAGFLILQNLKRNKKPFMVFDWKRNYRDLIALPEFQDVQVYTIGRDVTPFTFNPLIPPEGTNPKTWLKKLNEVIAHSYCLGNGVLFLLQQAVDAVYEEAGVYNGTVQIWPTFKDILIKARGMDTRGREAGWLSSTLRALATLCFGDMDKLLNSNSNQNIDRILDKDVILELDALTQSDKTFFVQSILLYLHHKRMIEPRRESFKHAVVIEEAHHVLSDERRSLVGGQSVMDIIFREIREFGESLILLDQHPSKISLYAMGNTYCTICMNLKHKADINAVGQSLLMDKERDMLGALEVGRAVVKLQGRIQRPFQIVMPHCPIQKGSIDDETIRHHMIQFVNPQEEKPKEADQPSNGSNADFENTQDRRIPFLTDVDQYSSSGIADRYKRMGISVRQGQQLKATLLSEGLIQERVEATHSGRVRIVKLTVKGKHLLANP
jgi:hypothetical protein